MDDKIIFGTLTAIFIILALLSWLIMMITEVNIIKNICFVYMVICMLIAFPISTKYIDECK